MVVLIRLLILVALVLLIWKLARDLFGSRRAPGAPAEFEATARCVSCGTHVPRVQLDAAGKCPRCK